MSGNANLIGPGKWANFHGKVSQNLWPAFKATVERGEFDFQKYNSNLTVVKALQSGFLPQVTDRPVDFGLNIGKITKEELAALSIWDLKNLYRPFYRNAFGLYLEFPDELVPEAPDEFGWPVCVPGIISNETAFQSGKLDLPRWKWTNEPLDAVMKLDRGRDAWTHSYIVRVRPNWEADEDLKIISGDDSEKKNINVMMLRERLILGEFLFWLTGEHLDRKTVTLTGSRCSVGCVPSVSFDSDAGKVSVARWFPDHSSYHLRSRQAVS